MGGYSDLRRWLAAAILLALLLPTGAIARPAAGPVEVSQPVPPLGICSEADRFAFGAKPDHIDLYDVGQLHAGWHTNFNLDEDPSLPDGVGFAQVIRIRQDPGDGSRACSICPTWDRLAQIVQHNPGSLWLVGNEPDRQDLVTAARYAELYHSFYTFLKAEDPTCQVGVGGVVQPTPIRLQYLDMILAEYNAQYGGLMPVDVWNVHNYVLRESQEWGGGLPPGADPALAILYDIEDHDLLDPHPTDPAKLGWKEHLRLMRRWMRDQGYRDRPLILTEFGILMPYFYGYDYGRVREFMLATFDWLMTAADAKTGYPADGNRLVQAWAWFSLDESTFETFPVWSHLFDPDTRAITDLGAEFGAYTANLLAPLPGAIDLRPVALYKDHPRSESEAPMTVTVTALIENAGAASAPPSVVAFLRDGLPAGEVTLKALGPGESVAVRLMWPAISPGRYEMAVHVDAAGDVAECDEANNARFAVLVIGDHQIYLPLVQRSL